jgi:26S proteasome regulatory subunit N1
LKEKLELLSERLRDHDPEQRTHALKLIRQEVSGATSSMTSVPKPLKFLSPSYPKLKEYYET